MGIVLTQVLIAGAGSVLFFIFLSLAYKTLKADKSVYRQINLEAGSFLDALRGSTFASSGSSSCRIREGLAIDTKSMKVVPQGTLSDDTLNSLLK